MILLYIDDDECTAMTDTCDTNAACTNTPGSFTCACNTGYSGDGMTCAGKYPQEIACNYIVWIVL